MEVQPINFKNNNQLSPISDDNSPISGSPENTEENMETVISAPPENNTSGGGVSGGAGGGSGGGGGGVFLGSMEGSRKKRGRPRKYDIHGNLNPAYVASKKRSPPYTAVSPPSLGFTLTTEFGSKRGRGKHSNAVNWPVHQQPPIAYLGGMFADTAGSDFIPHVITVQTGEDVAAKIHSVGQTGPAPRGVCVLAANGAISNVTIRQPGSSSGLITYEGRFEILSLKGSYTMNEANGVTTKTGGLSISLAGPDGRVVGGNVAGWLTAANPIQVVVGTFVPYGSYKSVSTPKRKYNRESTIASDIPGFSDPKPSTEVPNIQTRPLGNEASPLEVSQSHNEADNSMGSGHNLNVVSSHNTPEWNNGSQHRIYPDINVSVPGI